MLSVLRFVTTRVRIRGLNRLLVLLFGENGILRKSGDYHRIVPYDDDILVDCSLRSHIDWYIYFFGAYRPERVAMIKLLSRPGMVAFDIGANIGSFSLLIAKYANPGSRVIALEPNPGQFAKLMRNLELNPSLSKSVQPLAIAVGASSGYATLHIPSAAKFNQGNSSLISIPEEGFDKIEVEVIAIDDYMKRNEIGRLDLIKLDAQGMELAVVEGAIGTIRNYRPAILMDNSLDHDGEEFWKLRGRLLEFGYSLYVATTDGPKMISENAICPRGEIAFLHGNATAL